jgi:hypothetical protein
MKQPERNGGRKDALLTKTLAVPDVAVVNRRHQNVREENTWPEKREGER